MYASEDYAHVFPTTLESCYKEDSFSGGPKSCGYDTVGVMFQHLLSNMKGAKAGFKLKEKDDDWQNNGILRKFSQQEMLETFFWNVHGLDEYGYVYIPA